MPSTNLACQFSFADGRACRMLRQPDHPSLCVFHARAERQLLESDRLGSELAASLTGGFMTATDINFGLGNGESGACPATAARAVSGGDSKETVGALAEEGEEAEVAENLELLADFGA